MTTPFNIDDTDVTVNPANIAYMMLVLMSATFDLTFHLEEHPEDPDVELIMICDDAETVFFAVGVPEPMGTLVLSILTQMTNEINGVFEEDDDDLWTFLT